mmetsp:Transcript_14917/g.53664  ORF Transcript_14917/g.53664 Transcript_14917/m.53664 type:complete len:291 (-) Transcript_14917:1340-2212(-)
MSTKRLSSARSRCSASACSLTRATNSASAGTSSVRDAGFPSFFTSILNATVGPGPFIPGPRVVGAARATVEGVCPYEATTGVFAATIPGPRNLLISLSKSASTSFETLGTTRFTRSSGASSTGAEFAAFASASASVSASVLSSSLSLSLSVSDSLSDPPSESSSSSPSTPRVSSSTFSSSLSPSLLSASSKSSSSSSSPSPSPSSSSSSSSSSSFIALAPPSRGAFASDAFANRSKSSQSLAASSTLAPSVGVLAVTRARYTPSLSPASSTLNTASLPPLTYSSAARVRR